MKTGERYKRKSNNKEILCVTAILGTIIFLRKEGDIFGIEIHTPESLKFSYDLLIAAEDKNNLNYCPTGN